MLSNVPRATRAILVANVIVYLLQLSLGEAFTERFALWPLGMTPLYGVVAIVTGAMLLVESHRLYNRARREEPLKPMRLFHWSVTYLTLLFVAIAVDALLH